MNQARRLRGGGSSGSLRDGAVNPYLGLGLNLLINSVLCVLMILAAVLREMPEFWLNSGGYPVLLRECVFWLFYPGMIVCGILTVAGTGGSWRLLQREPGIGSIFLMVCGLEMLVVTAATLIAL